VVSGELSTGALVAVTATGGLVTGLGLRRQSGAGAAAVGRGGRPWLAWLAAAGGWELWTLVDPRLPTLSDLADPALAHPPLRGLATLGWLLAGAWLVTRAGPKKGGSA
jgi:hypothetical protein